MKRRENVAKLFLIGDFQSDNGPGTANKQILRSLSKGHIIRYSKAQSRPGRIIESFEKIIVSDAVVICSKSQINYFVINVAKHFKKKIFYVMHGCSSYEAKLNNPNISEQEVQALRDYEYFIVANADKTICVSEFFMDFMKHRIPEYKVKFDYIYNCIDIKNISQFTPPTSTLERNNQIVSIGGGMKHKNILSIVKAAQQLQPKLPVFVIGVDGPDSSDIKRQENTEWEGLLSHSDVLHLLSESKIYVQNSTFETFGLAAIEALYCGCDLLISDQMGCKDLFSTLTNNDVINDVHDQEEIRQKLDYLEKHSNNKRLREGFRKELVSHQWQLEKFNHIFEESSVR
jgi:glycosyltransferase involved in cell wall biosynthesis